MVVQVERCDVESGGDGAQRLDRLVRAHQLSAKRALFYLLVVVSCFLGVTLPGPSSYFASDGSFSLLGRTFGPDAGRFAGFCVAYAVVAAVTTMSLREASTWIRTPILERPARKKTEIVDFIFDASSGATFLLSSAILVAGFSSNFWFVVSSFLGALLACVLWIFGFAVPDLPHVVVVECATRHAPRGHEAKSAKVKSATS